MTVTFAQVTVGATSIGFPTANLDPSGLGTQARVAVCRCRTAEVSFTIDGTTPTSAVGTLLEVNDVITIRGHEQLQKFRAIRTGSSGQLDCTFFSEE